MKRAELPIWQSETHPEEISLNSKTACELTSTCIIAPFEYVINQGFLQERVPSPRVKCQAVPPSYKPDRQRKGFSPVKIHLAIISHMCRCL